MEQEVLTQRQKEVLRMVASEELFQNFYLAGGTALSAYYLHHRVSDDLDFFSAQPVDTISLHGFIQKTKEELGATDATYQRLHSRNIFNLTFSDGYELKLEFTEYPFTQFENTIVHDGVQVDSLRDIAANKLMALLDRFDPKDFVDLYFLLQERGLDDIRKDAQVKFGIQISDIFLGSELAKVARIKALPKMFKELSVEELKDFFSKQASTLKLL